MYRVAGGCKGVGTCARDYMAHHRHSLVNRFGTRRCHICYALV